MDDADLSKPTQIKNAPSFVDTSKKGAHSANSHFVCFILQNSQKINSTPRYQLAGNVTFHIEEGEPGYVQKENTERLRL